MSYNSKLTALKKGTTPIYADQDRINFAPQLREDIRILTANTDENGNNIYFNFNKVYESTDTNFPELGGTVWVISDIEGWFTTPDLEMPNIQRGYGDGSFDVDGRFVARDIELKGSVLITSGNRDDIGRLNYLCRQKIIELFNLVRRGSWLIVDEDALIPVEYDSNPTEGDTYMNHKRACFVRLTSSPEIVTVNSRGRIEFSIGLRANDPVKYEWVEQLDDYPEFELITGNGYNFGYAQATVPSSAFRGYDATAVQWEVSNASNDDTNVNSYSNLGIDNSGYVEGYQVYSGDTSVSSQQSDGGISAINHGNTSVGCYIRVLGPIYGPAEILNATTGQTMTILATQTEGVPVVSSDLFLDIDTRSHEVHLGDFVYGEFEDSSRGLLAPLIDWIYLQPGENVLYFTDYGSQGLTPTLQVYWRSGWIG